MRRVRSWQSPSHTILTRALLPRPLAPWLESDMWTGIPRRAGAEKSLPALFFLPTSHQGLVEVEAAEQIVLGSVVLCDPESTKWEEGKEHTGLKRSTVNMSCVVSRPQSTEEWGQQPKRDWDSEASLAPQAIS